ncbi:MAG TPA: response regulator transcription factor [Flavobacteriia bacterium]|jgi:two-component system LytT family response regulator|nr:response regulator transcription factor [Flavobacteriia bacterium]
MITCILVDDEAKALKMLEKKLHTKFPELEIIASFQEPEKAVEEIAKHNPDLVFLDIAMPNMSGFDLLSKFENPEFEVIFVTAYDSYALEAIKHAAIGYIVKPIDDESLANAIEKAKKNIQLKVAKKNNKVLLDLLTNKSNTISVPTAEGYRFIKIDDLVRLEGAEGYTKIVCCNKEEYLSSYNLGKFLEILGGHQFFQPHRSHIINLKHVTGYLKEGYIELINNTVIPLSKQKRKAFLDLMSND